MSNAKMYVCMTTTITLADRSMIAPGTPFRGEDLVPATLESMLENSTIQEFDTAKPPASPPTYRIGKTDLRPKKDGGKGNEASNIGMHRKQPEIQSTELDAQKTLTRARLKALGVTMPHNARLDTMEDRLERGQEIASITGTAKADTGDPGPAQSVWDADPKVLAEIPEERLLAMYREVCEKHGIKKQKFDNKELLIKYMSSQFVKK